MFICPEIFRGNLYVNVREFFVLQFEQARCSFIESINLQVCYLLKKSDSTISWSPILNFLSRYPSLMVHWHMRSPISAAWRRNKTKATLLCSVRTWRSRVDLNEKILSAFAFIVMLPFLFVQVMCQLDHDLDVCVSFLQVLCNSSRKYSEISRVFSRRWPQWSSRNLSNRGSHRIGRYPVL